MKQTPIHDVHNQDVLSLIPERVKRVVEVGCSSGALAREFKKIHPDAFWHGLEINSEYAEQAKRYCDETSVLDIETCNEEFFESHVDKDLWIFADVLEHLVDPWSVLKKIRGVIPEDGSVLACLPNAQHWSVILRLISGNFVYEDAGLLDRTHLRWFTRKTIIDLFVSQGFKIIEGRPRIFKLPDPKLVELLSQVAASFGMNSGEIKNDILPFQYVVRAIPV